MGRRLRRQMGMRDAATYPVFVDLRVLRENSCKITIRLGRFDGLFGRGRWRGWCLHCCRLYTEIQEGVDTSDDQTAQTVFAADCARAPCVMDVRGGST
jgi:hypothetical protein